MVEYKTYAGKGGVNFLVTHQRVEKQVIVTTPLQKFYVMQNRVTKEQNIEMIIYFIEKGYIYNMTSLIERLEDRFLLVPLSS